MLIRTLVTAAFLASFLCPVITLAEDGPPSPVVPVPPPLPPAPPAN